MKKKILRRALMALYALLACASLYGLLLPPTAIAGGPPPTGYELMTAPGEWSESVGDALGFEAE